MPDFLGDGPGNEDCGGSSKSVGGRGFVLVICMLIVAGQRRVLRIFKMPMRPTVGGVWAEIGATRERRSRRGRRRRWCHRARDSSGSARLGGARSVSAVEAGRAGGGGEAAILVGRAKVEDELVEGLQNFGFSAPVAARDVKEARSEDEVVSEADNRRG